MRDPRLLTASRDRIARAVQNEPLLADLDRLGLLAPDWRARLTALKRIRAQPMALIGEAEAGRNGDLVVDALCAHLHDAVERDDAAMDELAETDRLIVHLPADTIDAAPGDLLAFELVPAAPGDDAPTVRLRRVAPGDHPLVDASEEIMRLVSWRVRPDTPDPEATR